MCCFFVVVVKYFIEVLPRGRGMVLESAIYDGKHAALMQSFISVSLREGFEFVGCEVPYNHYGDRGVVDVVLRKRKARRGGGVWQVCELKPVLADVGETIRQVHRAREYFQKARPDLFTGGMEEEVHFLLVLEASEHNLTVLRNHADLFTGMEVVFHHENHALRDRCQSTFEIHSAILEAKRGSITPPIVATTQ